MRLALWRPLTGAVRVGRVHINIAHSSRFYAKVTAEKSKVASRAHLPRSKESPSVLLLDENTWRMSVSVPRDRLSAACLQWEDLLISSMRRLHSRHLQSRSSRDYNYKRIAWEQLQRALVQQIQGYRGPSSRQSASLSQLIQPSGTTNLLEQLVTYTKAIPDETWRKILQLQDEHPISAQLKWDYIIEKNFDLVLRQEVIPAHVGLPKTDDITSIDISNPTKWFPEARKMRRHIVMHLGPTNSGKTYRALKQLQQVEKGYYGGPLRLLAREVYDRFKSQGIRCNLLTGEEIVEDLDQMGNRAGLTSGTIEMIPLNRDFDVVVLDEIQMMADEERGWAWTNALLGVRGKEVHVCGEPSTLELIRKVCQLTGDRLSVNKYERLGDLTVESQPILGQMSKLRKGDCLVAFSKKKILDLKLKIERETGFSVAVIYGSLPPETRVQQADLFNSGKYDILVASDAIGMGLNLSIDRVIFTTDKKFNGSEMIPLTNSNIRQIGGRAGRFKEQSSTGGNSRSQGHITGWTHAVLKSVREGIESPVEPLQNAIIWPTDEICTQLMVRYPPNTKLGYLLEQFAARLAKSRDQVFKLSDLGDKLATIALFEHIPDISFPDKLRLSTAPVKRLLPLVKAAFIQFCETIAQRRTRGLLSYDFPFHLLDYKGITDEDATLEQYEALYHTITLYFWLANRYTQYFVDTESARDLKYFCELIVFEKLDRLKRNPYLQGIPRPVRTHQRTHQRRQAHSRA